MSIKEAYEENLRTHGHIHDPAQEQVVDMLFELQLKLVDGPPAKRSLADRLLGRPARHPGVRGLYLWGGVGRGKTLLMDLFFQTLELRAKRRNHFHRIMQEVHERLGRLGDIEDPLDQVAEDIASETRVLCFDEFFVSDIGDAMILGRLLERLFDRGVTLVATSNSPPAELYRDGLQRQRFLPAIAALEENTHVHHLGGDTDYRLRLLEQAGTYLLAGNSDTPTKIEHFFSEAASSAPQHNRVLEVHGRELVARQCGKSVVWFDFDEICDGPRSQADYITIARWYQAVIVTGVPQLTAELENQARRFIALVDEFYDRRVKLIIAAAVDLETLYAGKRLRFEFERTTSRLIEMQSSEYLHQPHLA
ncbi:MAG: cell division protein ZapE [Woeseiaceae bacterium]|nr:cell division protein ZapE [Woeseiaceae bacterium]